jgi:hypothetical protein
VWQVETRVERQRREHPDEQVPRQPPRWRPGAGLSQQRRQAAPSAEAREVQVEGARIDVEGRQPGIEGWIIVEWLPQLRPRRDD